jgi:hypothetical protein
MMRANRSIAVTFIVGFFFSSGIIAQAQVADMFVDVGGTVRDNVANADGPNHNRVVLAPANGPPVLFGGGTIEISALQAGTPAMLERVVDADIDNFQFHNVRIKRITGPVTNFVITYSGTAQTQPATPPSYYYNLEANGSWGSDDNKPKNNSFTFTTYIKPSGGSWTQYQSWTKSVNCLITPCAAATFSSGTKQSSSAYGNLGTNPRDLKGTLTITLSRDHDSLNFNNGTGAKAKSGAQLDCDWTDTVANWFRDDPQTCVP